MYICAEMVPIVFTPEEKIMTDILEHLVTFTVSPKIKSVLK